jgi:hypothetical protein
MLSGTASQTPPRWITALYPLWLDGGPPPVGSVSVGSGKPLTPCERMHSESLSICCVACAEAT